MTPVDPKVPLHLVPPGSVAQIINGPKREYLDLPAVRTPRGQVITRWTPTTEERARLLAGDDIFVTIWSAGTINPLSLDIGLCDWTQL